MEFVTGLQCVFCGKVYSTRVPYTCPACGITSTLDVQYDTIFVPERAGTQGHATFDLRRHGAARAQQLRGRLSVVPELLRALGLIARTPRMLGVQAVGAAPITAAFRSGAPLQPIEPKTIADSIAVGYFEGMGLAGSVSSRQKKIGTARTPENGDADPASKR